MANVSEFQPGDQPQWWGDSDWRFSSVSAKLFGRLASHTCTASPTGAEARRPWEFSFPWGTTWPGTDRVGGQKSTSLPPWGQIQVSLF